MTEATNINNLKGKILMTAIVLVTMLVALAATSKPAEAYNQYRIDGQPGGVTGYQIQGSHYNTCQLTSVGDTCWTPWVYTDGPIVGRSPATTGNQAITVVYQLQRWNGNNWEDSAFQRHSRTLYAGYSRIQMPNINITKAQTGHFRVNIGTRWTSANGVVLGNSILSYNQSGDYACRSNVKPCSTGAGWVYLG